MGLSFHFFNSVLWNKSMFIFDKVQFTYFFLLLLMLLASDLRIHCEIGSHADLLLCPLTRVLALMFRFLGRFKLYLEWCKGPVSLFHMWLSSWPTPFVEKTSFPNELSYHPCKKSVDFRHMILFPDCQISFIHLFIFMLVSYCLGYCHFVVSFGIQTLCDSIWTLQ